MQVGSVLPEWNVCLMLAIGSTVILSVVLMLIARHWSLGQLWGKIWACCSLSLFSIVMWSHHIFSGLLPTVPLLISLSAHRRTHRVVHCHQHLCSIINDLIDMQRLLWMSLQIYFILDSSRTALFKPILVASQSCLPLLHQCIHLTGFTSHLTPSFVNLVAITEKLSPIRGSIRIGCNMQVRPTFLS